MKLRRLFVVALAFYARLIIAQAAFDACNDAYDNQSQACYTAQHNGEEAAWTTYNGAYFSAYSKYANAVSDHENVRRNAVAACDATLWAAIGNPSVPGDHGSCYSGWQSERDQIWATYDQAAGDCNGNQQCLCKPTAERDLKCAINQAMFDQCYATTQNEHDNKCVPDANAKKEHDDYMSLADFWYEAGVASATYQKTYIELSWARNICDWTAWVTWACCWLEADCAQNPRCEVCCPNRCAEDAARRVLAAQSHFAGTVGPASAQNQHDITMCYYTHQRDDQKSYAVFYETTIKNDAKKAHDTRTADINYDLAITVNGATCQFNIENCICDGGNQSDCRTGPEQERDNENLTAYEQWRSEVNGSDENPVGTIWLAWNAVNSSANTTLNGELAAHAATDIACVEAAEAALDAVLDPALRRYNDEMADSARKHEECLRACCPSNG